MHTRCLATAKPTECQKKTGHLATDNNTATPILLRMHKSLKDFFCVATTTHSTLPSTAVPDRPLHTNVQRLSITASSIRYLAFFGGSTMLAQPTWSTRPVALELSTRHFERSGSWQGQLQVSAEDAFIYTVLKNLANRDVSGQNALQIHLITYLLTIGYL